jgi:YfiR/HmsC-like
VHVIALARAAEAEPPTATEHEVKAAFLFNFGKFVTWPSEAFKRDGTLAIGVLGDDPIAEVLEHTVRDKQIQDRRIDIRRLRSAKEAGDSCQMVFIAAGERDRIGEILQVLGRSSVLTVSDMPDFVDRGGMISLLLDEKKVRFEVNLFAVEQAGLKMSSQLLKLARRVIRGPE